MHRKNAFTLIELLIVVAIIAILAAIAVPNFLEAQVRSKVSRAKADLRSIITALESYQVDNNKYPIPRFEAYQGTSLNNASAAQFTPGGAHTINTAGDLAGGITSPIAYITSIPKDPFAINHWDTLHDDLAYQNVDFWIEPGVPFAEFGQALKQSPAIKDSYGSYIVRSLGPYKNYVGANNPYDPTNGTVSRGNIYRTALRKTGDSRSVGSW